MHCPAPSISSVHELIEVQRVIPVQRNFDELFRTLVSQRKKVENNAPFFSCTADCFRVNYRFQRFHLRIFFAKKITKLFEEIAPRSNRSWFVQIPTNRHCSSPANMFVNSLELRAISWQSHVSLDDPPDDVLIDPIQPTEWPKTVEDVAVVGSCLKFWDSVTHDRIFPSSSFFCCSCLFYKTGYQPLCTDCWVG